MGKAYSNRKPVEQRPDSDFYPTPAYLIEELVYSSEEFWVVIELIETYGLGKKHIKIFGVAFFIVFSIYLIIKKPVFNYLNITKSSSAEYIGMPLQQVGRMAFKNVKFTEDEKELINELMPLEVMAVSYNPRLSDGIKFNENYNSAIFDNNKLEYLKLYLKLVKIN